MTVFRFANWTLTIISALFELFAIYFIVKLLHSHCVRGGEYSVSIWFLIYFLPGITLHTIFLAIYRIFCSSLGLDPISIIFNLTCGALLLIAASILLYAMKDHCGNESAKYFYIAGVFGLLAGVCHICNGVMCLFFIPLFEFKLAK
ncbi:PREDICTED: uncharacterized protein LOC108608985 isoform X2 [Drosophila arizonae]|uniref:Uncharacterized protein LOC108608985 isoform X2 n=1 Tax=Drosophila arizonae TaxID=7263 RepID=A0ABM1NMF2_DROAR|nr:PREDICTED: uncharacterized protein LOC108608985 isoform X2 [Drosophila arizonae]